MMKKQRIIVIIPLILCFFYTTAFCADSIKSSYENSVLKRQENKEVNEKNRKNASSQLSFSSISKGNSAVIEKKNAFSKEWLALIHYKPTLFFSYKSSIDSSSFFLSAEGAVNPLAEYKASIALFQGNDVTKQCLFPARYLYLKEKGAIQKEFPTCPEFQQFKKDLNPAGVTLIYTDAYMNNPASLFGHTLMRIDIPEGKTQLVAHGMNYGAFVDPNENGLLFAVYGLTGGYYGGFTVKPYYNVINMYNNIENRDIWEFQLNLTDKERDFYVAHLWELGHTQTRYYFFTKNCSYLLMEVLDAIRPGMELADQFPFQSIPLDTLKAVSQQPDFIKATRYRPSRQRRIAWQYAQMTSQEKEALIAYLVDIQKVDLSRLTEKSQITVLDTAYEYIQYQWVRQDISLSEYRQKSFAVLRQRREIQKPSTEVTIIGSSPLLAHESARLAFSSGWDRGRPFQEISLRPAYHSLTDSSTGLLRGAEINFLDFSLRYYDRTQQLYFQNIDILKISSLAPYNALFHPLSYQVQTFVKRTFNPKTDKESSVFTLKGGSGLTFEPLPDLYLFGLVNTVFSYGGGFMPHRQGIALSISGGMGYYFKNAQLLIQAEKASSDNWLMRQTTGKAEFVMNLSQNLAVGVSYEITDQKYHSSNEVKMTLKRFF